MSPQPADCPECGRDIDRLGGNPDCPVCAGEPSLGGSVTVQRLIEDGKTAGWGVDLKGSPLPDTSSRFFRYEDAARAFAAEVAALVIAPVIDLPDDVL